ncbi:MAG: saccharopine dehydrogenase NADP-binding domain-containing protein [Candidatus Dormibacteria bacterium]
MSARIVLFGATGYTGALTAEALVAAGATPVLAGRSPERLRSLGSRLGGLETAVADVEDPGSVAALVERGDVLLTTVGPFGRYGAPAVEAAISKGATYIDSTGEPAFIRRVFEEWGPRAEVAGTGLVTACGADYVPGNLAGALALDQAGEQATRVEIGYFATGSKRNAFSGGTMASMALASRSPGHAFHDGRLVSERGSTRVRSFEVDGEELSALSIGATEQFTLPRYRAGLRDVEVYLGWFGKATRAVQAVARAGAAIEQLPGVAALGQHPTVAAGLNQVGSRLDRGSTGGPSSDQRARSGSVVVAIASDAAGTPLARVRLTGPNGYTFTGAILAWAAIRAAERGLRGAGALGPIEAFGLESLMAGAATSGMAPTA